MPTIPFDPNTYPALRRGGSGPEAPSGFGGVSSFNGRVGAVLPVASDYNSTQIANVSTVPGANVSLALDALEAEITLLELADIALAQPFRATYYVNPLFVGVSTGSQSSPFVTIAAAFAAAIAAGYTGCLVLIPPNLNITENVVFPSTGGNWEIASVGMGIVASSGGSRITGSITCNCTAATQIRLTNISITGNTAGDAANALLSFTATSVRQNGSITLTISGTGAISSFFRGLGAPAASKNGGSNTLLVSVRGQIQAANWVFEGGITEYSPSSFTPYPGSQFHCCWFGSVSGSAIPIGLDANTLNCAFYDCIFVGPTTFTSSVANYVIYMDGASLASLNHPIAGIILVGTNLLLKTINANSSDRRTLAADLGASSFGGRNADGLYEAIYDQTLLVAGIGLLQLNIIYTDMTGTLVTVPVPTTLNLAGAVGLKAQGSLVFRHNGAAAPIAFSYTGITPGTASIAASVALMCRT